MYTTTLLALPPVQVTSEEPEQYMLTDCRPTGSYTETHVGRLEDDLLTSARTLSANEQPVSTFPRAEWE